MRSVDPQEVVEPETHSIETTSTCIRSLKVRASSVIHFLRLIYLDARKYHTENRYGEGLPRAYSIRFEDPIVAADHPELLKLNGQTIIFGQHCSDDTGVILNGHEVSSNHTSYVPATKTLAFRTFVEPNGSSERYDVGACFSFEAQNPTGTLAVGARAFNVVLDPKKVWFDVKVSANAGAIFSSGDNTFKWKEDSDDWKKAVWEQGKFQYGWNMHNIGDEDQARWVAECEFVDSGTCVRDTSVRVLPRSLISTHQHRPLQ